MCFTLELFDTPDIPKVLAECKRVCGRAGAPSSWPCPRKARKDFIIQAFEWTHRHFPNLMDCRPIYTRRRIGGDGLRHRGLADGVHAGSRGDCAGRKAVLLPLPLGIQ